MRTGLIFLLILLLFFPGFAQKKQVPFQNVSEKFLPLNDLKGLTMDAFPFDLDGDGDLDIMIANEHRPNILLINDGSGKFSNESQQRIPQVAHDSEEVAIADFDQDGDPDIIVVSEDDQINEYYLNDGKGYFQDVGNKLTFSGTSNCVFTFDFNADGYPDLIVGNNGQNFLMVNDQKGGFNDETRQRLGDLVDVTQDIALGDLDSDGDIDLVIANEGNNRVLINDGSGVFKDLANALPYSSSPEETREVDLGDIDGDGDLDIVFGNVQAFVKGAVRQNRLLINDGKGYFTDVTENRLPADEDRSFSADFIDIDGDNDLDILTANVNGARFEGSTPFRVYVNDGKGYFSDDTALFFTDDVSGRGFDIDFVDFNGDGKKDFFLSNRGTADILLFAR